MTEAPLEAVPLLNVEFGHFVIFKSEHPECDQVGEPVMPADVPGHVTHPMMLPNLMNGAWVQIDEDGPWYTAREIAAH